MSNKIYDYAIIGSGISGIVISEILSRQGKSVIMIEKNKKLASETTRDFHEWIHIGSLYTLIPDNLYTLKFLLGAIDDLLEYYSDFDNMNLVRTEKGLKIEKNKNGWFNNNMIHFKFRLKNRKWTFPWIFGVARAIFLINKIKEHDWLRRRAGEVDPFRLRFKEIFKIFVNLMKSKSKFFDLETPDFTANSRNILNDLLNSAIKNGLEISVDNEFLSYNEKEGIFNLSTRKQIIISKNIVFANGANLSNLIDSKLKVSYAPMAIIKNIQPNEFSYVELDYYPKNCINILTKEDGIDQIGGISFSDINKCDNYIDEVIEKHKIYNPKLQVIKKYIGKKSEIILNNQPRNYLYHILNISNNVYGIIPGKFTLGFSIAPEFYRKVYKNNPVKYVIEDKNKKSNKLMSNTVWKDAFNNKSN